MTENTAPLIHLPYHLLAFSTSTTPTTRPLITVESRVYTVRKYVQVLNLCTLLKNIFNKVLQVVHCCKISPTKYYNLYTDVKYFRPSITMCTLLQHFCNQVLYFVHCFKLSSTKYYNLYTVTTYLQPSACIDYYTDAKYQDLPHPVVDIAVYVRL